MTPKTTCRYCFLGVLLIGLACSVGGPLLDEAVALALLDATLTPQELKDDELRERTQNMIDRAAHRYWPIWVVVGAGVVVVSTIGLKAIGNLKEQN
jgi:hypothetical protein